MKKARIIVTLDVSGSMGITKKAFAKQYYKNMKNILSIYFELLDPIFICHTTVGSISSEEYFFIEGKSGGTYLSSGIEQIYNLKFENENKFLIMFSDGDNWVEDNEIFANILNDLKDQFIRMYFVEIRLSTYESTVTSYIKNNYQIDNLEFLHFSNYTLSSLKLQSLDKLISTLDKLDII